MLRASPAMSALLPLLLATGALAQETGGTRRVDVSGKAADTAPALAVAPGVITALVFDTPLDLAAMREVLAGLGSRFALADPGTSRMTLTLMPSRELTAGMRQRLEVHFAEGEAPRRAAIELVAGPEASAERQVEVRRRRPPPEVRLAELEARGAACEAEVVSLRRWSSMPLAMLVLEGELKPTPGRGVAHVLGQADEAGLLDVTLWAPAVYRTRARAVLAVRLQLAPGARPWRAGGVVVRDASTGRKLTVHGAVMSPPVLHPGGNALWAVEWELLPGAEGAVDVQVLEQEGSRHIGIKGAE